MSFVHPFNRVTLSGRLITIARSDRSGVALILVIGLLALMVVMGVTFSIFMRTERVAAGNFRNDVVARQLLHVALNRALKAIDDDLAGKVYPSPYLESGNSNDVVVTGAMNAPAMDWIPKAALGANANPQPKWIDLTNNPPAITNIVEGRIGFLVVNCSGLVDANQPYGLSRSIGTNSAEIQAAVLPDVGSAGKPYTNPPYASMQELTVLYGPSIDLVDYSACPPGRWDRGTDSVSTNVVDIGGDEATLTARAPQIKSNLVSCLKVSEPDADFIFKNLLDYVDSDCWPRDLESPCTESVPMINEVQVQTLFSTDPEAGVEAGSCMPVVTVDVEWSYPFVKASSNSFTIKPKITITTPAGSAFTVAPIPSDAVDAEYKPNQTKWPALPHVVTFAAVGSPVKISDHVGESMSFTVTAELQVLQDAHVVDEVKAITINTTPVKLPSSDVSTNGMECIDPRFNWDASADAGQWLPYADVANATGKSADRNGSKGEVNAITRYYFASSDVTTDHHDQMFVADAPLKLVSELSYLLRGAGLENQWNTIRLYDGGVTAPLDPILDYFRVGTPTKGRINPNTKQSAVIAALMKDLPLDNYPGEAGSPMVSGKRLDEVTNMWMSGSGVSGTITNLSDIGYLTDLFALPTVTNLTFFQKEALLRNSAGFMAPRQQYFVILLYAQTTRLVEQIGKKNKVAETRGSAEVWRDAYPNESGHHPYFIRLSRAINEP